MPANFPTSAPSFSAKTPGQSIASAHVNSLQDETVAIGTWLLTQATTPYTPTWTNGVIGTGSLTGRYLQIGKLVFVDIHVSMGSTTTFGGGAVWAFSLPVAASGITGQVLNAYLFDFGTAFHIGMAAPVSSTTVNVYSEGGTSGITATLPFTWADNDVLRITGWYVAA